MDSAVVRSVLALSQASVLLHAGLGDELGVLVSDAVAAFVIGLGIVGGPPIAKIAIRIELSPLVVVSVNGFVPNDRARGRIIYRVILRRIEKWRLQNPCREIDRVSLCIFIGVHGWRRHSPLGSV